MIKDLNIIVPLRDEDEQVETTVNLLTNELKDLKKKFIITLIDDHSGDETWDLLKKLKEKYNNIEIYKNEYEAGYGNAVRSGIEKNTCDAVVFFMGDCSDNPKDIKSYVDYLDQGFDCVFGSRFMKNSKVVDLVIFFTFFFIKTKEFFDPGIDPLTNKRLFSRSDLIISRF